ncbi:prostaglandin reductase 1 [Diabrotica virgifera virgifera]|uniref:Prostaglandin reductase 1 n=1 Tax=Diabrotica virgifera virgifera TaxID=50390 RepID=A0A6P7G4X6_DIAVI|nr:prostaglandin reductase 1 [Diabrotica virgifera virgifera]
MVKGKRFVLNKVFEGFPKEDDFKMEEYELPSIKYGEFLTEAVYLSVDPYMRAYISEMSVVGKTMMGTQVAKILESKNAKYPPGKYVVGTFGWQTHTVSNDERLRLVPDLEGLPPSLCLGVLGMPGNTAYFGFLEICQPKPGETVVVSGAAGAVGSHVGQIAKIKGCTVIGIAGSDEKGKWLTEELGFDHFINYKTANVAEELKNAAPKGVDCYFDNVGGVLSSAVIQQMNLYGRISVCGSISSYNDTETPLAPMLQRGFTNKQLKMEGFNVSRWHDRWMEGINQNLEWIKQGKIKYHETITEGFENMFKAFTGMLKGENTGKAIVKV